MRPIKSTPVMLLSLTLTLACGGSDPVRTADPCTCPEAGGALSAVNITGDPVYCAEHTYHGIRCDGSPCCVWWPAPAE